MGIFSRSRRRHRILLLGPTSVGKTTLLYRLADQPLPDSMVPTAAAVLEKPVEAPNGHKFIFSEQKEESTGVSAILYVISRENVNRGVKNLKRLIEKGLQPKVPILILINKQDTAEDDNIEEVAEEIAPIIGTSRSWGIAGCSGTKDEDLLRVMDWLETQLPLY